MNPKKKIVIIGPVYPYKGGISHYTGMLCRTLDERYEVTVMSYKMQYPRVLYKKEQKDYRNDIFKVDHVRYELRTANPLNWVRVANQIKRLEPDAVIIQWWHPYFAPCYFMLCNLLKKTKVIFLCHNVFPHERFPMDRFLTKLVLSKGSGFIVHSEQDERDLLSIKPNADCQKATMPTFQGFKIQDLSRSDARKELHIPDDQPVLLFFGFVREYKGLKHLLNAMPLIVRRLEDVKLLVVGDFAGDKETYLNQIAELSIGDHIAIRDGYVPDNEVEKFFAASDLVVLPYESATQSGIVQIAYSFEKPVVATNVGGLPEVVLDGQTGYIAESENSQDLASKIIEFFDGRHAEKFRENIIREADKYSWTHMMEKVDEFLT